ncbi:MAG: hypothetical protein ABJA66_04360 [Actinomycetota bacterium]
MLNNIHKFLALPIMLLMVTAANGFQAQTDRFSPLEWGRKLVENVLLENTDYQHKNGFVKWKGIDGATEYGSHTDCSGLLNALLERSYNLKSNDFKDWLGVRRPLAITYHDAIENEQGFTRIKRVTEIKPGDIIAIKYPPDSDNSGHIMMVEKSPHKRAPTSPIIKSAQQWEVTIIDSSESGHGKTDTRRLPDGSFAQGVGEGIFRLYTDQNNVIIGYSWSNFANSEYQDQAHRHLVVGRLEKSFAR